MNCFQHKYNKKDNSFWLQLGKHTTMV